MLSEALLSQAKKSECGMAQQAPTLLGLMSWISGMPEPLPETRALTNQKPRKSDTEWKKERKKEWINEWISICRSKAYYVSAGKKLNSWFCFDTRFEAT